VFPMILNTIICKEYQCDVWLVYDGTQLIFRTW
jgi:hypothetical protein